MRDAAIKLIDAGSSLDRWREAGEKAVAKRKKVLLALKEKLLSPQPQLRKIRVSKPVKKQAVRQPLKPAELRRQLRAIHCTLQPTRGASLTSVSCHGGMNDELLESLAIRADTLESLFICHCDEVTVAGLQVIGQFHRLRRLIVRNLPLTDSIIAAWHTLKQLEVLELHGPGISDVGVAPFSACSQLTSIELCGTSVGDKTVEWIGRLPRIRELWLRNTKVSDRGLGMIDDHSGIRQLFLAGTSITDQAGKGLARMPKLTWLDVADTPITDKMLSLLAKNHSIRALDVQNTRITDKCLPALLSMKQLCYLNLENTGISQAGQRRLREGLPLWEDRKAMSAMQEDLRK